MRKFKLLDSDVNNFSNPGYRIHATNFHGYKFEQYIKSLEWTVEISGHRNYLLFMLGKHNPDNGLPKFWTYTTSLDGIYDEKLSSGIFYTEGDVTLIIGNIRISNDLVSELSKVKIDLYDRPHEINPSIILSGLKHNLYLVEITQITLNLLHGIFTSEQTAL